MVSTTNTTSFTRDRLTWFAYASIMTFAFLQAGLGPMVNLLRDERSLNYTRAGFHFSVYAIGIILAGSTSDWVINRVGRRTVWLAGGCVMSLGALGFALSSITELTIASAFLFAISGVFLLNCLNAALSDHHGTNRAVAITEANVWASISATSSALLVGGFALTTIGWRGSLYFIVVIWLLILAVFARQPVPDAQLDQSVENSSRRLPSAFWLFWIVLFLSIAAEWCVIYWGADYLKTEGGFMPETASSLMSIYFVGNILARAFSSRLLRTIDVLPLLLIALATAIAGFLLYWQGPGSWPKVFGLFVAGLGISVLFPLAFSAALNVTPPNLTNSATSRVSLAVGLAILIMPQLVGSLADQIGIRSAYTVVPVLLIIVIVIVGFNYWRQRTTISVPM